METKKRKLPARASTRSDAPAKKRTPSQPSEQSSPAPPTPPPVVEETLPKSIAPGKPLPVIPQAQPLDLPNEQYQTVQESGVMADSLERSRRKWLSEGIFEKYWTKPSKKKGPEDPKNPPKDSMAKIGSCTITIEPHVFDAIMYAVKDTTPRPPPPQYSQQPPYRPVLQYGPPNGVMPPPPPPPPAPVLQKPVPQAPPRIPNPLAKNAPPPPIPGHNPGHAGGRFQGPNGASSAPPAGPSKGSDPVIQMLAERAASDPDLKGLMRIVADGKATGDELKKFQDHIDELTLLLQKQRAQAVPPVASPSQHRPPTPAQPYAPSPTQQSPVPRQPTPNAAAAATPSSPHIPAAPQAHPAVHQSPQNLSQSQAQALRSKGPVTPSKPDISAVVFEFAGGSGDRFLFPKFSILEYLPHGQVIASFLIVRKGSSADSKAYDPNLDYYQPVTIRLFTSMPRQLDSLSKVVAPPEEVRRYMDDIMDNMTRAEYVLLAMRLPREKEIITAVPSQDTTMHDAPEHVMWTATAQGHIPQNVLPPPPPPTEDQMRINYIRTIQA